MNDFASTKSASWQETYHNRHVRTVSFIYFFKRSIWTL